MATKREKKVAMGWFVLACEPGQDTRLRRAILAEVKKEDLQKDFGRIVIVHHLEDRQRNGEWVQCRVKSFPGYLIINMRFNEHTYHLLETMKRKGAFGLLNLKPQLGGTRYPKKEKGQKTPAKKWELERHGEWKPTPIHDLEAVVFMLNESKVKKEKEKATRTRVLAKAREVVEVPVELEFKVGEMVKILEGTFASLVGKIIRATPSQDGQSLTVELTLMGRSTKIGIGSDDVERV